MTFGVASFITLFVQIAHVDLIYTFNVYRLTLYYYHARYNQVVLEKKIYALKNKYGSALFFFLRKKYTIVHGSIIRVLILG